MLCRLLLALSVGGILLVGGAPTSAQDVDADGVDLDCEGVAIEDGVAIIVRQMPADVTFIATAVGVSGFDPVLAVLNQDGDGLCNDDDDLASEYIIDLPTVFAYETGRNAQVNFSHSNSDGFQDVTLVVGGYGGTQGEFVLVLEGMSVDDDDNGGDAFSVQMTPGIAASGIPLTAYMMTSGESNLDPLMYLATADFEEALEDEEGAPITCDDAGNSDLCWGEGTSLESYGVTTASGTIPGWQYDAMIALSTDGMEVDQDDPENNFLNFVMTRYDGQSEGGYLAIFHMSNGAQSS